MSVEGADVSVQRRRALACMLAAATGAALPACVTRQRPAAGDRLHNPLLWAVAWKQTAAEYRALCYQAFNVATMRLDLAVARRQPGDRPLAIITDVDDTVLHAPSYWGHLVDQGLDFFDDAIWDAWVPQNLVTAAPGASAFLHYAASQGVEVFYVTNRDQGEETAAYALAHLRLLEFPFADEAHLTVLRETSDKTAAREAVAARFDVVLLLGDNLNDFSRDYYLTDVDARLARADADRDLYGARYIVLPNPTDGHWVRAIFGDSEPAPTDANRATLKAAATRSAWDGRPRR
ncbi:MAG: HAD family acid phosphatase [Vicinamibacterales bacterium]|nr:HAD family acid phosphatase [Vicinamibacterales bacterium]